MKHLVELQQANKPHNCARCPETIQRGELYLREFHNFVFNSGKAFHRTKNWHNTCFMLALYEVRNKPDFRQSKTPRRYNTERHKQLLHRNYIIKKLLITGDPDERMYLAREVIRLNKELNVNINKAGARSEKVRALLAKVMVLEPHEEGAT